MVFFTKPVHVLLNEVTHTTPTHLAVVSLSSVVTREMTPVLMPMENTPVGRKGGQGRLVTECHDGFTPHMVYLRLQ